MRIAVLSDLHVDVNGPEKDVVTPALSVVLREMNADVFITAGDISGSAALTAETLTQLEKDSGVSCLFVPGNHDLWSGNGCSAGSAAEARRIMAAHPGNLANGPVRLKDDWYAAGDTGWYDYSFGTKALFSRDDFAERSYNGRVWQDSIKTSWGMSDEEVSEFFIKKIEADLDSVSGNSVVAVTHMLPLRCFTVPVPDPVWDYFNAFLGSESLGRLFLSRPEVKYSVSGHVHYRKEYCGDGTVFICNCLGYSSEWRNPADARAEIARSVKIIEI